jgi:hypothetical protein
MRTRVALSVRPADLDRLRALVKDRDAAQKHVWRAQVVLRSAEGLGKNAIMRETGKSKTCVWRTRSPFRRARSSPRTGWCAAGVQSGLDLRFALGSDGLARGLNVW